MSSVKDIAKKLNKDFNNENLAILADTVPNYERIPLGSLGADFPLYGGLPLGRIIGFSGQEHSGKSLMSAVALAAYQKRFPDKMSVYVDAEHALDKQFTALMTGVDFKKVFYVNPESMSAEDITQMILDFQSSDDIGMIILDSIPAMQSAINLDTDMGKDNGMRGSIAKTLHRFLGEMADLVSAKNNIFLIINQVRKSTTFTGAIIYNEPGGDAPKYYRSVGIRCGKRTFIKGDKADCSDGEGADGFRINFVVTKNKTASVRRGGGFVSFNYETGIDPIRDLLEIALKFEYIKRPTKQKYSLVDLENGEVYTNEKGEELTFVGKDALISFLNDKNNKAFVEKYFAMLNRAIVCSNDVSANILDSEYTKEIKEEEAEVDKNSDTAQKEELRN